MQKRITLVRDLWGGCTEDRKMLPVTAEQRAELDSRLRAYQGDKDRGRPAGEVLPDVRRRLEVAKW